MTKAAIINRISIKAILQSADFFGGIRTLFQDKRVVRMRISWICPTSEFHRLY